MNGFGEASKVEARALAVLLPYLDEQADGRVVLTSKGTLARFLQITVGDAIFNDKKGRVWSVELKAEEKHTGNLFLETWSNKNLTDAQSHAERGSTMGWLFSCRADLLMYYFLDSDDLHIIPLLRLKRWAFGLGLRPGRLYDFPEVEQHKYGQPNDTHGRLVEIATLASEIEFKRIKVRQLALFTEGQPA